MIIVLLPNGRAVPARAQAELVSRLGLDHACRLKFALQLSVFAAAAVSSSSVLPKPLRSGCQSLLSVSLRSYVVSLCLQCLPL